MKKKIGMIILLILFSCSGGNSKEKEINQIPNKIISGENSFGQSAILKLDGATFQLNINMKNGIFKYKGTYKKIKNNTYHLLPTEELNINAQRKKSNENKDSVYVYTSSAFESSLNIEVSIQGQKRKVSDYPLIFSANSSSIETLFHSNFIDFSGFDTLLISPQKSSVFINDFIKCDSIKVSTEKNINFNFYKGGDVLWSYEFGSVVKVGSVPY